MSFEVKIRTWWKENPEWPNGLEPCVKPWRTVRVHKRFDTEEEARDYCQEYNRTHPPGRLSRKAEFGEA